MFLMTVAGLASALFASIQQPPVHQVNISGATLFVDFFRAPASTNDYIDVDGDGYYGYHTSPPYVDQLATAYTTSGWSTYWSVAFRGVGSGTGLSDLVTWHSADPCRFADLSIPSERGVINRVDWAVTGVTNGNADPCLPGGCPVDPCNIDIAVMDVPTNWFVYAGSATDAQWNKKPQQAGYGRNPQKSWTGAQSNQLKTLGNLNTNVSSPDVNTVFDAEVAWVPIAIIANQGVGTNDGNFAASDLQYLFITGRMPNGENLAAATRDSGSGTRNAAMNTMGMDPSFGRGDNVGAKFDAEDDAVATTKLGKNHRINNCGGSGIIENAIQYTRLGIGYTGLCGASRSNEDARGGLYEICSIKNVGGTAYVRATLNNILDNNDPNTGWRIGGNETFVTVGSPNPNATYTMSNPYAGAYINNITASIRDFVNSPGLNSSYNMPGEYMAFNYFLTSAVDALPDKLDPTSLVPNANLNQSLQNFIRTSPHELSVTPIPAFGSVKPSGMAPVRATLASGNSYSDGSTTGSYTDSGGNVVNSGVTLSERNKIMGDFNYAGAEKHKRNMNDIGQLVAAVKNPRAFEQNINNGGYIGGQAGDYVVPEIIGDFDGDGNFIAKDVRYFADGLAIDPVTGKLNRSAAFTKVDQADAATSGTGNYFGTTLATGRAYEPNSGWSKADVAGDVNATPGANPTADGIINAKDIDYIYKVLRGGLKAEALGQTPSINPNVRSNVQDWNDLDDAAWMDLSCDMNGDLIVDSQDIDIVVHDILGTNYGDVNLDGKIDANDRDIILANMGSGYGKGWAQGDINGDGYVTADDLNLYHSTLLSLFAENWLQTCSAPSWCEGMDYNQSGRVDFVDFATLAQNW